MRPNVRSERQDGTQVVYSTQRISEEALGILRMLRLWEV